jgi:ribosomal protein L37E
MSQDGALPPPESGPFTLLGQEERQQAEATRFTCAFCGARFTHGGKVCAACPLNAGCDLVKCPNCGYQFPRTSRIVEWVSGLLRRAR